MQTLADAALGELETAERIPAPFPLWLIETGHQPRPALLQCLSAAEHERAERFAHAALRHRYQAAHCALRLLVETITGIPAAAQTYLPGEHGKPVLVDAPAVHCSLSYSGDFALVGVDGAREIGVDLEVVQPIADAAGLASMYYTRREIAQLAGISPEEAGPAFLTVWVRKEACSKALGKGLTISPASYECGVGCGIRSVLIEQEVVESEVLNPKGGLLAAWARRGR
ncbi:4'-phosphopantetheinyl transferase superfamily protein [Novosphingobium sp. FGD1]|uniref:4'-phosphopantetheinyl transferase superfamily protein n=1 Tax=Novosphingobium silvae TaxID=2692619 RepID=A0A7X4GF56_9SPHN|nr:4'-phosphopantetheinyl transferase superfamily protein [Novosphingobium silvae]